MCHLSPDEELGGEESPFEGSNWIVRGQILGIAFVICSNIFQSFSTLIYLHLYKFIRLAIKIGNRPITLPPFFRL